MTVDTRLQKSRNSEKNCSGQIPQPRSTSKRFQAFSDFDFGMAGRTVRQLVNDAVREDSRAAREGPLAS
jgi:hypothetical protein